VVRRFRRTSCGMPGGRIVVVVALSRRRRAFRAGSHCQVRRPCERPHFFAVAAALRRRIRVTGNVTACPATTARRGIVGRGRIGDRVAWSSGFRVFGSQKRPGQAWRRSLSFGCIEVSERELHYELLSTTLEIASLLRGLGAAIAACRPVRGHARRPQRTGADRTHPGMGAAGSDSRHDRSSAVVAHSIKPIPLLADRVGPGAGRSRATRDHHSLSHVDDSVAGSHRPTIGRARSRDEASEFAVLRRPESASLPCLASRRPTTRDAETMARPDGRAIPRGPVSEPDSPLGIMSPARRRSEGVGMAFGAPCRTGRGVDGCDGEFPDGSGSVPLRPGPAAPGLLGPRPARWTLRFP
jgi:hypothetical protein